jgi:hypothetical protein
LKESESSETFSEPAPLNSTWTMSPERSRKETRGTRHQNLIVNVAVRVNDVRANLGAAAGDTSEQLALLERFNPQGGTHLLLRTTI